MQRFVPLTDANFAIRCVEQFIGAAFDRSASDIHVQPRIDHWEILFRIDGVLESYQCFPRDQDSDPVSRLMALAGLPSYRMGVPQEGPLRWKLPSGQTREMRLGIFPTVHGSRAAIRIVDANDVVGSLDQLGFDDAILLGLKQICDARDGCFLVSGPAGSGKTTTLYACLSYLATQSTRRSVLTIEDPIESIIDSISQSQIESASGLTLGDAMRAAVRQDAEVLLVSEIRDAETAEAVLSASMTGHLCFSSLHAASIGSTLRRLVQMNLPSYAIQSGIGGILCQRLLRRICQHCRRVDRRDCRHCHQSGYHGRIPIGQSVQLRDTEIGERIFDALVDHAAAAKIDELIRTGGHESLHCQAERWVSEGQTDHDEVFRVLGEKG